MDLLDLISSLLLNVSFLGHVAILKGKEVDLGIPGYPIFRYSHFMRSMDILNMLFPMAMTVKFESLGLGVVRRLFAEPKSRNGTGTLEPCNLLLAKPEGLGHFEYCIYAGWTNWQSRNGYSTYPLCKLRRFHSGISTIWQRGRFRPRGRRTRQLDRFLAWENTNLAYSWYVIQHTHIICLSCAEIASCWICQ